MLVFNAFYYSFSPEVASFISSHSEVRAAMRMMLYPLIGTLYLSEVIFGALSFNGEIAVIISGIFASVSIGAIYIGPFLTTLTRLLRLGSASFYVRSAWLVSLLGFSSVLLVVIGELLEDVSLLEVATVGLVMSSFAIGGFAFSCTVNRALLRKR